MDSENIPVNSSSVPKPEMVVFALSGIDFFGGD
jgi:hypothetical protein